MFDKRDDLARLIAVAEAGQIQAAADRLAMTQPGLTRTIARLEMKLGGRLFERLPSGMRPTPLGERAVALARGVLREIAAAEEKMGHALAGREGRFRITATPIWMEAIIAPAVAAFLDRLRAPRLRALPTEYGRLRYRTGFVARRAAEDLEPFRLLEDRIRNTALGRGGAGGS